MATAASIAASVAALRATARARASGPGGARRARGGCLEAPGGEVGGRGGGGVVRIQDIF